MACDCDCIYLEWVGTLGDTPPSGAAEYQAAGIFEGCSYFEVQIDGFTYYIFKVSSKWILSNVLGGAALRELRCDGECECPCGNDNEWVTPPDSPILPYEITSLKCGYDNCCFLVSLIDEFGSFQFQLDFSAKDGIYNCAPYWEWQSDGGLYYRIYLFSQTDELGNCIWHLEIGKPGFDAISNGDQLYELIQQPCGCPISQSWNDIQGDVAPVSFFATGPCVDPPCIPMEDRHQRKYDSIKLPEVFMEPDRGFKICCDCPMKVLAGGSETWENDITSAWIKLSSPGDAAAFILKKDGVIASYIPAVNEFPNEANAFYATIPWADVLSSDGIGCYSLEIEYNISGIQGTLYWGQYNLMPYSIENALETARIRVKYNLRQEIEGINFTGANVEDCIRFNGFIGDRQPNTEIDNLIYQNRVVKSVVRENLDQYTISTDPLQECFILPLTDLFLLSENEMWISDYNAHNHSYRINDIPVIVEESPEIDYLDRWQRRAALTCVVGLRKKDRRTYY